MIICRRSRGSSLLEVLIASVILVGVVLIVMRVLHSSASTASKGSITSDLEDRGARLTGFCREEFLQAQFTGTITPGAITFNLGIPSGSSNTAVGYRMPGNLNASGVAVAGGNVVFGYASPLPSPNAGFRQDLACFLRFEADTLYKETSASPAASQPVNWGLPFPDYPALGTEILNRDLNRDGDSTDTFVKGKIYRYVVAPAGSPCAIAHSGNSILVREPMSDNVILRVVGAGAGLFNGNIEGDAAAPPSVLDALFRFIDDVGPDGTPVTNANLATDGRGIQVIAWHGTFDDLRKGFLLRKSTALLRFRNTQ